MKKKKKRNMMPGVSQQYKHLNPIITINEPGESLYVIADFSLPGTPRMRRILSKKLESGNISAVIYEGIVGPDKTCSIKQNILQMTDAPKEKFWKAVRALQTLYQAAGGISEIRCYEGKTVRQAAEMMQRFGNAQVWIEPEKREHNL